MNLSTVSLFLPSIILIVSFVGLQRNSQNNILTILVNVELMFLSANVQFLFLSDYLDDMLGQVFSLFIISIVACESAIALALLVVYFRLARTSRFYDKYRFIKLN